MSKENDVKILSRKSAFIKLDDGWHKDDDFMEVTEWSNKEGWDVQINDNKTFSLHFTEYDMLKKLIKKLEK